MKGSRIFCIKKSHSNAGKQANAKPQERAEDLRMESRYLYLDTYFEIIELTGERAE